MLKKMKSSLLAAACSAVLALGGCASNQMSGTSGSPLDRANPQMRTVLDTLVSLNPKPIESLSPTEARRQPSASDAVIQTFQNKGLFSPDRLPPVGEISTTQMPGVGSKPMMLRVYTPPGDGPFPVIVYFHGGGWVLATLDTYDSSCRALCFMARAVVVSVDYRRAPEYRFPAAPEDCYAATQFVCNNIGFFHGKIGKVAVAGESAGGNLATVVCMMAKQRGGNMPVHQALIYPVTNYAFNTQSYMTNADAKPLNAAMMHWFFKYYLSSPDQGESPMVSPLKATDDQLRGLPPATVITDEIDPLHDEGIAYADRLKSVGVDVKSSDYAGVTHEFFGMGLLVTEALEAEKVVSDRLSDSFNK